MKLIEQDLYIMSDEVENYINNISIKITKSAWDVWKDVSKEVYSNVDNQFNNRILIHLRERINEIN